MTSTRAFLSLAALLSALAGLSALFAPGPPSAPVGTPAASSGGMRVAARRSHGLVHAAGSTVYAEVSVRLPEDVRPPTEHAVSLVLVLDRSGSMDGAKLAEAKRAAFRLVELLGPDDELGLVHFGTDVTAVPRQKMTSEGKAALTRAIHEVQASGSTNISEALARGQELLVGAPGPRRLVLVSDGQPTAGDTTAEGLSRRADALHADGVTLSALGVGHDYDGPLMQRLAERGGGMYGYLASAARLEEVLGKELAAARRSSVRSVELELATRDGLTVGDVPGRWFERRGDRVVLHLADLVPGMTTRAWVQLHSSRVKAGAQPTLLATVRWKDLDEDQLRQAAVSVPFLAVADGAAFEASKDEAVFSDAVSALGSVKLAAASAAYERGDEASALSFLSNARSLFGMSADALAGEARVDRVQRDFEKADATERKRLSRALEKKMSDFGKENEGY